LPSYTCLPNVRPRWLSRFLGHKNQTIAISILLAVLAVATFTWANLFMAAGALIGLVLSPDLDLSWSRLGLFGKISLADEYTKLFKHRKISHVPVIGTLTRAPVFGIFVAIFFLVTGFKVPWRALWLIFWGMVVGDTWHIALDHIGSNMFTRARTIRSRR